MVPYAPILVVGVSVKKVGWVQTAPSLPVHLTSMDQDALRFVHVRKTTLRGKDIDSNLCERKARNVFLFCFISEI